MLEEEPRLIMEDVLADIEEREFRGLDDIRANGSEWQPLDILRVDDRQMMSAVHWRMFEEILAVASGRRPVAQDEGMGFRMAGEPDPVKVHHLALVPAK